MRVKRSGEPLAGERSETLVRDPDPLDQQKHAECHADGGVQIGGGHRAQMLHAKQLGGGRQRIHRQDVHEILQEHDAEDRDGERRDEFVRAVIGVFHHAIDAFHQYFDRGLQFAGHTAGGTARGDREYENEDEGDEESENYAVDMDGPECAAPRIHGEMREVVLDIARHPSRHVFFGHHSKPHIHDLRNRHFNRINPTQ